MTTENLKGKRILVTGGNKGLGRAIVEALLARGAEVIAVGRDEGRLAEVARQGATPRVGDVTDPALMETLIREVQPSIVILNAGAAPHMGPIDEQTWESFSVNWNTDAKAGFYGVQAALRVPLASGSRVLLASSGAAKVGAPLSGSYVGAKWMLWAMAHAANAIARERDLGIQFQVLAPMQLIGETSLGHMPAEALRRFRPTSPHATVRNL
jgi:NAD(P)-dependent dehydrogenase (short-subunit alcohol dehydrogenase family)